MNRNAVASYVLSQFEEDCKVDVGCRAALESIHGKMDGFFRQLPYKFHLEEVASVGD